MTKEQEFFVKNVKILYSPQEKQGKNSHIVDFLDKHNIKSEKLYAPNHLKQGDYTFEILGKDYRDEILIERKFGIEELYACLVQDNKTTKFKRENDMEDLRDNLECEFARMKQIGVKEKWLFIENCNSFEEIRNWRSGYEKKDITAGELCYYTLLSWCCGNRYDFKVTCLPMKEHFAPIMILKFFYYFRNDMKNKYGKNWLTKIKGETNG